MGINWDCAQQLSATLSINGSAMVTEITTLQNILQLTPLDASTITRLTCNRGVLFYGDDNNLYNCKSGDWK